MFDAKQIKNEIVDWIKQYFEQNGKNCTALIGISGGKDSSIVAALCAKTLGADRVFGVLMPNGIQRDIDVSYDLVDFLGIRHCAINIKNSVDALFASIEEGGLTINQQVRINTPARARMAAVYAVSAVVGGRVANTSNLSEEWVGYSTKYGVGTAGDFSPLSRLTVTEVKAVGRALGLPSKFIDKTPEDGLTGLTDEENLGFTYDALDKYIREGICEVPSVKERIDRLHSMNLHKVVPIPCYEMTAK